MDVGTEATGVEIRLLNSRTVGWLKMNVKKWSSGLGELRSLGETS